ncbi:ATP-binding protein [Sphingosinicella sp. BN140058]|uniref:ATP-binding protein n=1 Tax=Sphingosinicella sp. BN140058 TaxID=1892855 RepID=UPI0013EB0BCF|nr:DUF87 domain-containing protein [Sphingosinicella sp. BN140058]
MAMAVELGRAKFAREKGGTPENIFWDLSTAISGHAIIVGSSGSGKTHRLRYLIDRLQRVVRNPTIHILDVHGDIAPNHPNSVRFSETTPYGLNPLAVTTDPEFGGVRKRINTFISMINRSTSHLGTRQLAVLRALLNDLYELNGYDPANPITWDPATNPLVSGMSAQTGTHPAMSDLTNLCAWRIKNLLTGSGSEAFRTLNEINKTYKRMARLQRKLAPGEEATLETMKSTCIDQYAAFVHSIETGKELDDLLNYESVEPMRAVYERLKQLDATGIFKDQPPQFDPRDPLRVYEISSLLEDEQKMFAEVLLERLFIDAKATGQKPAPDTFIVIDEAHKFMTDENDHILNRMAREVRKFGVGLILVSQNFEHFPEDLIANSAMTMILGLHDLHHKRAASKLGLKVDRLKWIRPKHTALVQVRSGSGAGLTNAFNDVYLARG